MKKITVNIKSYGIGIFVLACFLFCVPVSVKAQTKLIGHRGYAGRYMENTIESMQKAYEAGFDGVEMDLWEGKNNILLIFHDKSLRSLTGKKGSIFKVRYSTRSKYRLKNGAIMPTLYEMLQSLQGKTNIFIHIKGNKQGTLSRKAQKRIVSLVKRFHLEDQVYLFAKPKIMSKLHFGKLNTGWLTTVKNGKSLRKLIRKAKKKKVDLIILLNKGQITAKRNGAKLVRYAHKRGIKIASVFENDKSFYNYLNNINVDYAITQYYVK